MRGPLDDDVIENLIQAIAALDNRLTTITSMLESTRLLKLDAGFQSELDPFAGTLPDRPGGNSHA